MDQIAELEGQISDMEAQIAHLTKRLATPVDGGQPIAKSGLGDVFDKLVAEEIGNGCPPSVAGQRVITKYGSRPFANQICKTDSNSKDFTAAVNAVMIEKKVSRLEAMQEARKRDPVAFAKYQEA